MLPSIAVCVGAFTVVCLVTAWALVYDLHCQTQARMRDRSAQQYQSRHYKDWVNRQNRDW